MGTLTEKLIQTIILLAFESSYNLTSMFGIWIYTPADVYELIKAKTCLQAPLIYFYSNLHGFQLALLNYRFFQKLKLLGSDKFNHLTT